MKRNRKRCRRTSDAEKDLSVRSEHGSMSMPARTLRVSTAKEATNSGGGKCRISMRQPSSGALRTSLSDIQSCKAAAQPLSSLSPALPSCQAAKSSPLGAPAPCLLHAGSPFVAASSLAASNQDKAAPVVRRIESLVLGRLVKRYKRFLADIQVCLLCNI